jgi:hypothetical protein
MSTITLKSYKILFIDLMSLFVAINIISPGSLCLYENALLHTTFVTMRKLILLLCLLAVNTTYAQLTDSIFYGNIKAGMMKSEYDQTISETRIRIMNDEYALVPTFHNDQELTELSMESEALTDYSVIEKKMLSMYEVISTKYGRANTLSLISNPDELPDGGKGTITYWDLGKKHISIGVRRDGDKFIAVYNVFIKDYEEYLHDRDLDREQKARKQAGSKF